MEPENAMTNGRVRIADVARAAGVGQGTASDALNGRGRISEATRKRVAEAGTPGRNPKPAMPGPLLPLPVEMDDVG